MHVDIYTDGAARGNPGPGGYGTVLRFTDSKGIVHEKELSQGYGWKNAQKQPVKNDDLWKRLLAAKKPHDVTFVWVKGHAGHPENERCDELATTAADGAGRIRDEGFNG